LLCGFNVAIRGLTFDKVKDKKNCRVRGQFNKPDVFHTIRSPGGIEIGKTSRNVDNRAMTITIILYCNKRHSIFYKIMAQFLI